ncbi:MAG: hypothetical protein GY861_26970 [bacterium]|nr:hypothetical protein [bacterium]
MQIIRQRKPVKGIPIEPVINKYPRKLKDEPKKLGVVQESKVEETKVPKRTKRKGKTVRPPVISKRNDREVPKDVTPKSNEPTPETFNETLKD